jgi:anti-sigma regulatory factor (Ser/Thr protein kinase)
MRPDDRQSDRVPLLKQRWEVQGGNFITAGNVSTKIKDLLKEIQISPDLIRRLAICCYEAEMNIVMYAGKGSMTLEIHSSELVLIVEDQGQGIPDINLAMQEGWSTATEAMREKGFGAGMGLPNIKRNADKFDLTSKLGQGTTLRVSITLT